MNKFLKYALVGVLTMFAIVAAGCGGSKDDGKVDMNKPVIVGVNPGPHAIIMDNGTVTAVPEITANDENASLIHEAAIGKIAGEQLIKLMTLGLTEKEAEEEIINGFLK